MKLLFLSISVIFLAWLIWRWNKNFQRIHGTGWGGTFPGYDQEGMTMDIPPELLYMPMSDEDFDELLQGKRVYFNKEHL